MVPHRSTECAQGCLTSEFGWDPVLPPWFDRQMRVNTEILPKAIQQNHPRRCSWCWTQTTPDGTEHPPPPILVNVVGDQKGTFGGDRTHDHKVTDPEGFEGSALD